MNDDPDPRFGRPWASGAISALFGWVDLLAYEAIVLLIAAAAVPAMVPKIGAPHGRRA